MASLWSEMLPGVNAKAEVTGGSVTNVIQVARHESDLGIAMADVVGSAYAGTGRFPEPLPLRVLFAAYPEYRAFTESSRQRHSFHFRSGG